MDYAARFEQIDKLTAPIANPWERHDEQKRLVAALYAEVYPEDHDYEASKPPPEADALGDAHQAWIDARADRAIVDLADAGCELIAASHPDHLEHIADVWPDQDSRTVRGLREQARTRRSHINGTPRPINGSALVIAPSRTAPRARARRERHVARSTSSSDSGDSSGEPDLPDLARPCRAFRRSCERCGTGGEVQWSEAAGAWACLTCHLRTGAGATDAADPPPPPKRTPPHLADWHAFRYRILDALDRIDASRFAYIDEDRIVHVCPVCQTCDGWLAVHFIGRTRRADVRCSFGCPESEIAHALGMEDLS